MESFERAKFAPESKLTSRHEPKLLFAEIEIKMYPISLQSGPKILLVLLSTCFGTIFFVATSVSFSNFQNNSNICCFGTHVFPAIVTLIRSLSPYKMSMWKNIFHRAIRVEPAAIFSEVEPRSRPFHLWTVTKLGRKVVSKNFSASRYSFRGYRSM